MDFFLRFLGGDESTVAAFVILSIPFVVVGSIISLLWGKVRGR